MSGEPNTTRPDRRAGRRGRPAGGFTLVELLVSIGIIVVLVGILIPVVGRVRTQGYVASTQAFVNQLQAACEAYQLDFRSYPGPLNNDQVGVGVGGLAATYVGPSGVVGINTAGAFDTTPPTAAQGVTGSENLVLGLLGGLKNNAGAIQYDPSLVGTGANSLNANQPKKYQPYVDAASLSTTTLAGGDKTGHYFDEAAPLIGTAAGGANDTIIPEFLDRFPQAMPVLYLRANAGANPPLPAGGVPTATMNPVVRLTGNAAQYSLDQVIGYTRTNLGEGRTLARSDYTTPGDYDNNTPATKHGLRAAVDPAATLTSATPINAYPYFLSASAGGSTPVARQKDAYILIAAGKDRVYGTRDDITNFGPIE